MISMKSIKSKAISLYIGKSKRIKRKIKIILSRLIKLHLSLKNLNSNRPSTKKSSLSLLPSNLNFKSLRERLKLKKAKQRLPIILMHHTGKLKLLIHLNSNSNSNRLNTKRNNRRKKITHIAKLLSRKRRSSMSLTTLQTAIIAITNRRINKSINTNSTSSNNTSPKSKSPRLSTSPRLLNKQKYKNSIVLHNQRSRQRLMYNHQCSYLRRNKRYQWILKLLNSSSKHLSQRLKHLSLKLRIYNKHRNSYQATRNSN